MRSKLLRVGGLVKSLGTTFFSARIARIAKTSVRKRKNSFNEDGNYFFTIIAFDETWCFTASVQTFRFSK